MCDCSLGKKKGRGLTNLQRFANKTDLICKINMAGKYAGYCGMMVKESVKITVTDWRPVTNHEKDKMWAIVKAKTS